MNNDQRPPQRRQYFDIARPGRTPASPNARPMLSSNRPPVQDSSMKPATPSMPANTMMGQSRPTQPQSQPVMPQMMTSQQPASVTAPQDVGRTAVDEEMTPNTVQPMEQRGHVIDHSAQNPAQHERHSVWSEILAVLAILLLLAIILDILLDANILDLPISHTNFFDY